LNLHLKVINNYSLSFLLMEAAMTGNLVSYYAQRAFEYEKIYLLPERKKDLCKLKNILSGTFQNLDVLEIACGTGYWTQFISNSAKSILATDCNVEMLEIAKKKNYMNCKVSFITSDAYSLANVKRKFTGGFCGFWWSHIPNEKLSEFISIFHSKLQDGAIVIMIDNIYVEGNSTPIVRYDDKGNSYQIRKLENGSEYEVLKNFPSKNQIRQQLSDYANRIEFLNLTYYWLFKYIVRKCVDKR